MVRSKKTGQLRNAGILVIRAGLGILLFLHGYPTVVGGPDKWEETGSTMQYLGVEIAPMFFGFLAGTIELFGGIFLIMGVFFTPVLALLLLVRLASAFQQIASGDDFSIYAHSLEMIVVFIGLMFIGPGQYSVQNRMNRRRRLY